MSLLLIPLNYSVGVEKFRTVDLLPKGYRGVSFKDWLELIVKAGTLPFVVDSRSSLEAVRDVHDC